MTSNQTIYIVSVVDNFLKYVQSLLLTMHFELVDGFVILMGTDTMAFTASALSFMLENLSKPVVFTGSQIPIAQPHSDARRNLVMALIFASRDVPINEVSALYPTSVCI
jgi:L-asparaginase